MKKSKFTEEQIAFALRQAETSCSRFEANQLRLFLPSAAYVLLHTFRRLYLRASQWAHAQSERYS